MTIIRTLAFSVCLLTSAFSISGMAQTTTTVTTTTTTAAPSQQEPSFLFVLQAQQGVIAQEGDHYTLTLTGMDNQVLAFSDRPYRIAGDILLSKFMSSWHDGHNSFAEDHPNAALMHAALTPNADGFSQALTVELYSPVVTKNGVTFMLKDISGDVKVGGYNGVRLFIDDGLEIGTIDDYPGPRWL